MAYSLEWDSGTVAAGAVIDSPVFDTRELSQGLFIIAVNSGAATRNITLDSILGAGTVVDSGLVIRTVVAGATERGTIGPQNAALGTPVLIFAYPITLPTKIQLHLVAGGAAGGLLI